MCKAHSSDGHNLPLGSVSAQQHHRLLRTRSRPFCADCRAQKTVSVVMVLESMVIPRFLTYEINAISLAYTVYNAK